MEVGVRLGQISEFSLLIAVLALEIGVISQKASYLIQLSTLLTFLVSSYLDCYALSFTHRHIRQVASRLNT